eukprot:1458274-Rhodomonas_salina.2
MSLSLQVARRRRPRPEVRYEPARKGGRREGGEREGGGREGGEEEGGKKEREREAERERGKSERERREKERNKPADAERVQKNKHRERARERLSNSALHTVPCEREGCSNGQGSTHHQQQREPAGDCPRERARQRREERAR